MTRLWLLLLAVVVAAYFDMERDAPLSAAIVLASGILSCALLSVNRAVPKGDGTAEPNTNLSGSTEGGTAHLYPLTPTGYAEYCEALVAEDLVHHNAELLLEEYEASPACAVKGCGKKRVICTRHEAQNWEPIKRKGVAKPVVTHYHTNGTVNRTLEP